MYSDIFYYSIPAIMSEVHRDILRQAEVLSELLDTPVADVHLAEIAGGLMNWEDVAPFLELSAAEKEEIRHDERRYKIQKMQSSASLEGEERNQCYL